MSNEADYAKMIQEASVRDLKLVCEKRVQSHDALQKEIEKLKRELERIKEHQVSVSTLVPPEVKNEVESLRQNWHT